MSRKFNEANHGEREKDPLLSNITCRQYSEQASASSEPVILRPLLTLSNHKELISSTKNSRLNQIVTLLVTLLILFALLVGASSAHAQDTRSPLRVTYQSESLDAIVSNILHIDMNEHGVIFGETVGGELFVVRKGKLRTYTISANDRSYLTDVNRRGVMVGYTYTGSPATITAWIRRGSTHIEIEAPPGFADVTPIDINDRNIVLVRALNLSNNMLAYFLRDNRGKFTEVTQTTASGGTSNAYTLDNKNRVLFYKSFPDAGTILYDPKLNSAVDLPHLTEEVRFTNNKNVLISQLELHQVGFQVHNIKKQSSKEHLLSTSLTQNVQFPYFLLSGVDKRNSVYGTIANDGFSEDIAAVRLRNGDVWSIPELISDSDLSELLSLGSTYILANARSGDILLLHSLSSNFSYYLLKRKKKR